MVRVLGPTEYKAAARSAPDSGLASDFVAGVNAAVHVTLRLPVRRRAKQRVKMKIMNFAARPFLAWRIIARHALSPSIPRA